MHCKLIALLLLATACAAAQTPKQPTPAPAGLPTISAPDLVAVVRGHGPKPLILQVGPERLYRYAHIPGAEYAGAAADPAGIQNLRNHVQHLKRNAAIVIYCGCCPWPHCPNIHPAYAELRKLGFTNVKALYLPDNFKFDWEDKGYPTERGQ